MILIGENRGTERENCLSATLSATSSTWAAPLANPGLCGGIYNLYFTGAEDRWEMGTISQLTVIYFYMVKQLIRSTDKR